MADNCPFAWPAALVCLGLLGGGWFIGNGFEEGRSTAATVTVKGLAERFVRADIAVWPLRLTLPPEVPPV